MKKKHIAILFLIIILVSPFSLSFSEEGTPDYRSFVDIIYEWTPYGDAIQVGDFTINKIESVWIDKGDGIIVKASKGDIKTKEFAKVVLKEQNSDSEGRWVAHKIILFSGKGLKTLLDSMSEREKMEYYLYH
jgi:hypothetical protein